MFQLILRYHQKKYRPIYDRYTAYQTFRHHSKSLKTLSQYSKSSRNNSVCNNLLNHDYPSKYIQFNKQKPQINELIIKNK